MAELPAPTGSSTTEYPKRFLTGLQQHLGMEKMQTAVFEDAAHVLKTAKEDGFITIAGHVFECTKSTPRKAALLYSFFA